MKYIIATLILLLFLPTATWADPGESTSISVCLQHQPFDLIDALNGNPTPGGQWSDPDDNVIVDGIFTPATSVAGIYTYSVDTGEGPETSTVEIVLVNCLGSPANDECFSAQFINPANGIPFSTFGATTDGLPHFGEENCEVNGEAQIENDVWYFYVADCDGQATVSTVGGTILDTKIAVYNFNCPPTTDDLLACNDDFGDSYQSSLTWTVADNGVYLIRLGESPGPGSGNGTFDLIEICFGEEAPENQFCDDAFEIVPDPAIPFSTFNAATDGPDHSGDSTCDFFDDDMIHNDVWYSYTATCDGFVTLSTLQGTTLDTRVAVYSENCPQDLSNLLACNDDFQGFSQSVVTWDIAEGEQYTIRLGNSSFSNGGSGTFSLEENCGSDPPMNDDCANAQVITPAFGIPFNTFDSTTDGPSHFENPVCTFFGGSQIELDVWYEYTASCDGIAEVSTVGGTFLDTRLAVYAEYCPGNDLNNLIACNDDDGGFQSTVTWTIVEGDTYLIRLGEFPGEGGGSGTFDLIETCMEVCATPVVGFQSMCNGLDDFDGFYVNANVITSGNAGPYLFVSSIMDQQIEISDVGVYEFGPFPNDVDVFFEITSLTDSTCFSTSYVVSADCYPNNLNYDCLDADQVFANQYVSYSSEEAASSDVIVESGCGFEEIYNELWYFYTAPCTGQAHWTNCAMSDVATQMVVYNNTCENDDLALLTCSSPDTCGEFSSSVSFPTTQGITYVLRLGTTSSESTGIGVFMIEQEIELVSAGTDSTLIFCDAFTGSIVLNNFLVNASPGGQWADDDGTGALIGNTLFFSSLSAPGEYHFSYEVQGPCNTDEATITIIYDICESVEEVELARRFVIFPNPVRDVLRIQTESTLSTFHFEILDMSGRRIIQRNIINSGSGVAEVNLSGLMPSGMYLVRLTEASSGFIETHKLIVQ